VIALCQTILIISLFSGCSLLSFPGSSPGIVCLFSIAVVHNQHFSKSIPVEDKESTLRFPVIDDLHRAIDGFDFLAQEMPAKVSFARSVPASTGPPIEYDFHTSLQTANSKSEYITCFNFTLLYPKTPLQVSDI